MKKMYKIAGIALVVLLLAVASYAAAGLERYDLPESIRVALLNDDKDALKGKMVLFFTSKRCKPCGNLAETLQNKGIISYIQENGGRFYQWEVARDWEEEDDVPTLCSKKNIKSVPVLLLLENGTEKARMSGYKADGSTDEKMLKKIKEFMQPQKK